MSVIWSDGEDTSPSLSEMSDIENGKRGGDLLRDSFCIILRKETFISFIGL